MSVNSKVPVLNFDESENQVQNANLDGTKQNYCCVCNIQCTSGRNFKDHKKGRKHRRNMGTAKSEDIKNDTRCARKVRKEHNKNKYTIKIKVNKNKSENPGPPNSEESEITGSYSTYDKSTDNLKAMETTNACRNYSKTRDKTLTRNRKHPSHKNYSCPQKIYHRSQNHFDYDYHTEHNSSYYYERQQYPYTQQYSYQWRNFPYNNKNEFLQMPNYPDNKPLANCVNSVYDSEHYFQPNHDVDDLSQYCNSEYSQIAPNVSDTAEIMQLKSSQAEQDSLLTPNNLVNSISSLFAEVRENADLTNDRGHSSEKSRENYNNVKAVHQSPVLNSGIKSKVQTMSFNSVDSSCNIERKKKDESENSPKEVDGEIKQQKIKDWTNTLLETSHGKISRLIHPSNYKDKAAVNQLITNLSKSKRKENLSRLKIRSDSLCSSGTNEDDDKDTTEDDNCEPMDSIEIMSAQVSSDGVQDIQCLGKNKKNSGSKCSKSNNETKLANERVPKKINKSNEKRKKLGSPKSVEQVVSPVTRKNSCRNEKYSTDLITNDKEVKRKSLDASDHRTKRQRCSDAVSEPVNTSHCSERNLSSNLSAAENITCAPDITKLMASDIHLPDVPLLNSTVPDTIGETSLASALVGSSIINQPETAGSSSGFSIETLIDLFASGNVKVKNEFNDPAIEAIKSVDPTVLINACSGSLPLVTGNGGERRSSDSATKSRLTVPESCPVNNDNEQNRNCNNPVVLGSAVTDENVCVSSDFLNANFQADVTNSNCNNHIPNEYSLSSIENIHFMPKNKSDYTPELKKLINNLREISSEEGKVKQNIVEAKCKINEYQTLFEEWKRKKKMFQEEEENLRKKRNDIIELMQNAVKTTTEKSKENENNASPTMSSKRQNSNSDSSINSPAISTAKSHQPSNSVASNRKDAVKASREKEHGASSTVSNEMPRCSSELIVTSTISTTKSHNLSNTSASKPNSKENGKEAPQSPDLEEISVIPVKVEPPELIVIDDDEPSNVSNSEHARTIFENVMSNDQSIYDRKNITAHNTVVNCVLVFEDFIYTCSNDNTARRFKIKDPTDTITYLHTARNVSEIVVEKVQSEALVFTSCTNKVISLFIASNGTKIKTFFQSYPILTICKGWGKFFSGMADGTINVYNWKYEEKEIVKTDAPASRIATAHQGRIHILIILSSDGNISLRDAETGLLIRSIQGCVKLPSWLTVHNDLAYLSSSDKTLTILDTLTGKSEKKLYVPSHTTGLSVYGNYIFTISYTGLVNCYNKENVSDRRLYYGAGKNGLTCIDVYQDWVYTGNRKGEVSVFHFDSGSVATCQFGHCCHIFGLKEDLSFHVEKDHLTKKRTLSKCQWGTCNYLFSIDWNIEEKMQHLNTHIY